MRKYLLFVVVLVAALMFAMTGMAYAQSTGDVTSPTVKNLFDTAQLIAWVGGVLLPFVVALLTKARAKLWVMSLIAVLSAGLIALGTYLADVSGAKTWRDAVSVFVIAVVSAAASRYTITGGADTWLKAKTPHFGVG